VAHAESNTEVFRATTVNVPGATLYQKSGDGPAMASSHVSPARNRDFRGLSCQPGPLSSFSGSTGSAPCACAR